MQHLAYELNAILDQNLPALRTIPDSEMLAKSSPGKWSKKEIIGHLIDSAQNNIRRFIVARYENNPTIVYLQDEWVAISRYQEFETEDLVQLWALLNRQLCMILEHTDSASAQRLCKTKEPHTLEWLAEDYIRHLKHHLHQVLNLDPVAYP